MKFTVPYQIGIVGYVMNSKEYKIGEIKMKIKKGLEKIITQKTDNVQGEKNG